MAKITAADVAESSWVQSLDQFVANADYLTESDLPQLKALYAIARQLDGGKFQAALISQFTLTQRNLTAKRGATEPDGDPVAEFMKDPSAWLLPPQTH